MLEKTFSCSSVQGRERLCKSLDGDLVDWTLDFSRERSDLPYLFLLYTPCRLLPAPTT